jgi:hypothetical protein
MEFGDQGATFCWERGRLARNAPQARGFLKSSYKAFFALRAHCGRDARAPSKCHDWFIPRKMHRNPEVSARLDFLEGWDSEFVFHVSGVQG